MAPAFAAAYKRLEEKRVDPVHQAIRSDFRPHHEFWRGAASSGDPNI
jgi:hypothetical protein